MSQSGDCPNPGNSKDFGNAVTGWAAVGAAATPETAATDPDLSALIAVWPTLPAAVKARILAMVKGARSTVSGEVQPVAGLPTCVAVGYLGDDLAGQEAVRPAAGSPGSLGVRGVGPASEIVDGRGECGSPGLKGDEWTAKGDCR